MPKEFPRIAVIGAGVAGISAAYAGRNDAEVVVYEAESSPGGHAHSVEVEPGIGADTGFIVFNRANYPQLSAFFDELNVETNPHAGQFTFYDKDQNLLYGSPELENDTLPSDSHLASIATESARFSSEGRSDFMRGKADVPLRDYLDERDYSQAFRDEYLALLSTAVWSAPRELIWQMPASTVIAYFLAHGGSGLGGRGVAWETVRGGSRRYVDAALAASGAELRLNTPVVEISSGAEGVAVTTLGSATERYDGVVIATHGDMARDLLRTPTAGQAKILAQLRYNQSHLVLHTDTSILPDDRERWASWNYGNASTEGGSQPFVAWYLNLLQNFHSSTDYVVSMDYPNQISSNKVLAEFRYQHPIIDLNLRRAQKEIYKLAYTSSVTLAGSYFHATELGWDVIGSHESAFSSGVKAMGHLVDQYRQ